MAASTRAHSQSALQPGAARSAAVAAHRVKVCSREGSITSGRTPDKNGGTRLESIQIPAPDGRGSGYIFRFAKNSRISAAASSTFSSSAK